MGSGKWEWTVGSDSGVGSEIKWGVAVNGCGLSIENMSE